MYNTAIVRMANESSPSHPLLPRLQSPNSTLSHEILYPKLSSRWVESYNELCKKDLLQKDYISVLKLVPTKYHIHRPSILSQLQSKRTPLISLSAPIESLNTNHRSSSADEIQDDESIENEVIQSTTLLASNIRMKELRAQDTYKHTLVQVSSASWRQLYDKKRWINNCRCDYCYEPCGELECGICNVIAHEKCFIKANNTTEEKIVRFQPPAGSNWICTYCETLLRQEYNDTLAIAKHQQLLLRTKKIGTMLKAYVCMRRDAQAFKKKRHAIIRIQALLRGGLARRYAHKLKRMQIKPYTIESFIINVLKLDAMPIGAIPSKTPMQSDMLKLANGSSCHPFINVNILDGLNENHRLFTFESSIKKGGMTIDNIYDSRWMVWPEAMFIPGVNANVTFVFTLLSRAGVNTYFLGQSVLRFDETDWWHRLSSSRITFEVQLLPCLQIVPYTSQDQPMQLTELQPSMKANYASMCNHSEKDYNPFRHIFLTEFYGLLVLNVTIRGYTNAQAYCGYLAMKNRITSTQSNMRWCVLLNGILRVYRNYGAMVATEYIPMAEVMTIRLVFAHDMNTSINQHSITNNIHSKSDKNKQQFIVIGHMERIYVFRSVEGSLNTLWLRRLQQAIHFIPENPSTNKPCELVSLICNN